MCLANAAVIGQLGTDPVAVTNPKLRAYQAFDHIAGLVEALIDTTL